MEQKNKIDILWTWRTVKWGTATISVRVISLDDLDIPQIGARHASLVENLVLGEHGNRCAMLDNTHLKLFIFALASWEIRIFPVSELSMPTCLSVRSVVSPKIQPVQHKVRHNYTNKVCFRYDTYGLQIGNKFSCHYINGLTIIYEKLYTLPHLAPLFVIQNGYLLARLHTKSRLV